MIWSMPIQAYYLAGAGIAKNDCLRVLLGGWKMTKGNDGFYLPPSLVNPMGRIGCFGMPAGWRDESWPNGKNKLAADSGLIAGKIHADRGRLLENWPDISEYPYWEFAAATVAMENPKPGYESPLAYAEAYTGPPITY